MTIESLPLVSILIISYNSSATILETLNSILQQNYQGPIDLIISDDCSMDSTVEICRDWISNNSQRFNRITLIETPVNTGVTPNCNRGMAEVKSEWVKLIAADDIMMPDYLPVMVRQTQIKSEAKIFISKMQVFGSTDISMIHTSQFWNEYYSLLQNLKTSKQQYIYLRYFRNVIPAPSAFVNVDLIKDLKMFDEDILLMEDYPMWLSATREGYKIEFVDQELIKYRASESTIQKKPTFELSKLLCAHKYVWKTPFFKQLSQNINQLSASEMNNNKLLLLNIISIPYRIIFKFKRLFYSKSI